MNARIVVGLMLGLGLPALGLAQSPAFGTPAPGNTIVIKDHQFVPAQLTVPAGRKLEITVDNQDATSEEFESFDLDREQIVKGHKKLIVLVGPLKPGTYTYWGDYHQDTAKGVINAQ